MAFHSLTYSIYPRYTIRLESKTSERTSLLFCTTGILMRRLEESADLAGVTHLFVDEVHERSMESDFLLMVLRDLLRERRPDLKLILMSATLDADLFANYFAPAGATPRHDGVGALVPTVRVPGRTFPVLPLFLEVRVRVRARTRAGRGAAVLRVGGRGTAEAVVVDAAEAVVVTLPRPEQNEEHQQIVPRASLLQCRCSLLLSRRPLFRLRPRGARSRSRPPRRV